MEGEGDIVVIATYMNNHMHSALRRRTGKKRIPQAINIPPQ